VASLIPYGSVGVRFYASKVTLAIDPRVAAIEDEPEVAVIDTNVLLDDACDLLAAGEFLGSPLLRAVDRGLLVLLMSEQAYREVGYMCSVVARRKNLDPGRMRQLIEREYLPRLRVVTLPSAGIRGVGSGRGRLRACFSADVDELDEPSAPPVVALIVEAGLEAGNW
jgi:hypothetical protein